MSIATTHAEELSHNSRDRLAALAEYAEDHDKQKLLRRVHEALAIKTERERNVKGN